MQLNDMTFPEGRPVDGYGPGFFRIAGQVVKGDILVMPDGIHGWSGYEDRQVILDHAADLDVIFVGTGAEMRPVPAAFRTTLESAGVGVEIMNSPTACRTYNVLLSEGRRVALALICV